jgi:hypothetical protein
MGNFWTTEQLVGVIPKNNKGDEIIVKKVTKGNKAYVDVRTFYKDKEGNLNPGKGITIPDDLADEVADLILKSGGE